MQLNELSSNMGCGGYSVGGPFQVLATRSSSDSVLLSISIVVSVNWTNTSC